MGDEPVTLRISEAGPPGRSTDLTMPRWRAEAIVDVGLERWPPRYLMQINPAKERGVVWAAILGLLEASLAFLRGNRTLLTVLGVLLTQGVLALLAIFLPASHYRAGPAVALAVVSFLSGFAGAKALDREPL